MNWRARAAAAALCLLCMMPIQARAYDFPKSKPFTAEELEDFGRIIKRNHAPETFSERSSDFAVAEDGTFVFWDGSWFHFYDADGTYSHSLEVPVSKVTGFLYDGECVECMYFLEMHYIRFSVDGELIEARHLANNIDDHAEQYAFYQMTHEYEKSAGGTSYRIYRWQFIRTDASGRETVLLKEPEDYLNKQTARIFGWLFLWKILPFVPGLAVLGIYGAYQRKRKAKPSTVE